MDRRLFSGMLTPILPPLALYMSGEDDKRVLGLNVALCALLWIPGAIHAYLVLSRG